MNQGGLGILAVIGAGLAALFFFENEAEAKPAAYVPTSDETGYQEAQLLQSWLEPAVKSDNPAMMRQTADKIRAHHWSHPEVSKAADKAAFDLDALAKSIEDYVAQTKAAHDKAYEDYLKEAGGAG